MAFRAWRDSSGDSSFENFGDVGIKTITIKVTTSKMYARDFEYKNMQLIFITKE